MFFCIEKLLNETDLKLGIISQFLTDKLTKNNNQLVKTLIFDLAILNTTK